MKIKANLLLFLMLLIVAAILNPGMRAHGNAILEGQKKMNLAPDLAFVETCEFHNYGFFSFSTYLGDPISIGLFGNVHLFYSYLENSLDDFRFRYNIRPKQGRGDPPVVGWRN